MEDHFATDSIELLIDGLARQLETIPILRKKKFWEIKIDEDPLLIQSVVSPQSLKFPIYKKGERPVNKFLDV